MGYLIEQALRNELAIAGLDYRVATLVSQVLVDPGDPAFQAPTKPVGLFFAHEEVDRLTRSRGWKMIADSGRGYRRVVPSPRPVEILGADAIEALLAAGQIVIAVGGGGIPVALRATGEIQGVEAVIDKDWSTSLAARQVGAQCLIQLTAVESVFTDYGQPSQRPIGTMSVLRANELLAAGHFPAGSMGPKVESGCDFLANGGKEVLITSTEHLTAALRGETGTRIIP
jgi:carbamate kinase